MLSLIQLYTPPNTETLKNYIICRTDVPSVMWDKRKERTEHERGGSDSVKNVNCIYIIHTNIAQSKE